MQFLSVQFPLERRAPEAMRRTESLQLGGFLFIVLRQSCEHLTRFGCQSAGSKISTLGGVIPKTLERLFHGCDSLKLRAQYATVRQKVDSLDFRRTGRLNNSDGS